MGLGTLTLLGMLWAPGQAVPVDSSPFMALNMSKMDIPIKYDNKSDIRELLLFYSRNQGELWGQYAVAKPEKDTFFSSLLADGLYWFQMVIVDKYGRRDPAELNRNSVPALRVLIDTTSPVIAIRSVDRVGDEATIVWDVQEANPDWKKFQVDYRTSDGAWIPVEAKGAATGSAKFRLAQAGPITVRLQAYDIAGNHTEMTKDLAAPPNVIAASKGNNGGFTSAKVAAPPDVLAPNGGAGTIGEPLGTPTIPPSDPLVGQPMKTEKTVPAPFVAPVPTEPVFKNEPSLPGSPLAVSPTATNPASGIPLPAAQVINVARFDLAYDVEQKGPSGISRAEIWTTRDDGKKWERWSITEKIDSPVTVDLTANNNPRVEGVYGIKIVLLSGAGLSKGPPVSGDAPDMRVDVDLTPPLVKIYEPIVDPNQKDTMILRWRADDRNLAHDPITLEWAEQADGPWNPIVSAEGGVVPISTNGAPAAKPFANTGQYAWKLPPSFPTHKVFVRVTARDTAGNLGEVRSPHAFLVDMNKPVAKIHGIIGAAPQEHR